MQGKTIVCVFVCVCVCMRVTVFPFHGDRNPKSINTTMIDLKETCAMYTYDGLCVCACYVSILLFVDEYTVLTGLAHHIVNFSGLPRPILWILSN